MGVLIKGGDVLESLGAIRVAAFDKTGTITKGEFSIDGFHVVGDKVEMSQLLYWVSSIESKSSHPMATALVEYSQSESIQPKPENVTEFRIYPGEGISGAINGRQIFIGNRRIMARSSCYTGPEMDDHRGTSIGYVIIDGDLVGAFSLSDDCRTGAAEAIRELRSMGIKSVMLTGDSRAAATRAQQQLGGRCSRSGVRHGDAHFPTQCGMCSCGLPLGFVGWAIQPTLSKWASLSSPAD